MSSPSNQIVRVSAIVDRTKHSHRDVKRRDHLGDAGEPTMASAGLPASGALLVAPYT